MSAGDVTMSLVEAREIYQALVDGFGDWPGLGQACHRIELAGSPRRGCDAHDLDIVAIPRGIESAGQGNLFGAGEIKMDNCAWVALDQLVQSGKAEFTCRPGQWKNKRHFGKAKKLSVQLPRANSGAGVRVEVDLVQPDTWGSWLMVRTGNADFVVGMMKRAKDMKMSFRDGFKLYSRGYDVIPTPEERDVFEALGLNYVETNKRTSYEAVHLNIKKGIQ